MRNRFSGKCLVCRKVVKAGEGYFQKINKELKNYGVKKWEVRCKSCVGMGNKQLTYPIKEEIVKDVISIILKNSHEEYDVYSSFLVTNTDKAVLQILELNKK